MSKPKADVIIEHPDENVTVLNFTSAAAAKSEFERLQEIAEAGTEIETGIRSLSWSEL